MTNKISLKNEISIFRKIRKKKKINYEKFLSKYKINKSEINKFSSDLQTGVGINSYKEKKKLHKKFCKEISNLINKEFTKTNSILDLGAGELQNTVLIFKNLNKKFKYFFACDFSLNRLLFGKKSLKNLNILKKINIFVSDIEKLPFKDNSIDVCITTGGLFNSDHNKKNMIKEILRVSRIGACLSEPGYEFADKKQLNRMRKYNYITNIPHHIPSNCTIKIIKKKININERNKNCIYLIKKKNPTKKSININYVDPYENHNLIKNKNYYTGANMGFIYPIIENTPIFIKNMFLFVTKKFF